MSRPPITRTSLVDDPLLPDGHDFQQQALGHVQRRVKIFHFLLYGSSVYLASGSSLIVRWIAGIDSRGAALMTDLGLLIMVVCAVCAGILATRPVQPSVAFAFVDQTIRNDRRTPVVFAVFWVLFCGGSLLLAPRDETARVISILSGVTVMFVIGVYGLVHSRSMRLRRDDEHVRRLLRQGLPVPDDKVRRRPVEPGPELRIDEPSDFELRAVGYAGRRSRTAFCFTLVMFLASLFIPLGVGTWIVWGDYRTWWEPALVSLCLLPVPLAIGLLRLRSDKPGKPMDPRSYRYAMRNTGSNRGTAIGMSVFCVLLFAGLAVMARPGTETEPWPLLVALPVMMLAFVPFLLKTGEYFERRRELYLAWMIRRGLVTEGYAKANPPR